MTSLFKLEERLITLKMLDILHFYYCASNKSWFVKYIQRCCMPAWTTSNRFYFQNKYIIYLKYSSFTNDKTFKHTLSLLKGHFEARKNERCKITFPGTDIQRKSCFMEQTYKE